MVVKLMTGACLALASFVGFGAGDRPAPRFHYHTRHIPAEHLRLDTRAGKICCFTNGLCAVTQPENLSLLKARGVDTVELRLTWEEIEKVPGTFDFSRFDRELRRVEQAGLTPGLMAWFNYAPAWYTGTVFRCVAHGRDGGTLSPWAPDTLRQMDRLYGEVAKRYGGRIGFVYVTGSGDFGEPVCPQGVNYYRFSPPHTHGGIAWTGDPHARAAWAKLSPVSVEQVTNGEADDETCRRYARFVAETTATHMAETYRIVRRHFPGARFGVPLGHFADFPHGQSRTLVIRKMCAVDPDFTARWSGMGFVKDFAEGNVPARRISSAVHFYGCRFGEEAAWFIDRENAPAALYESIANGSTMLHNDFGNIVRAPAEVNRMMSTLRYDPPKTEVALLWPDDEESRLAGRDPGQGADALAFVGRMREKAAKVRAATDYAICDSTMVKDGFLSRSGVRRLYLLDGRVPEELAGEVGAFKANGGVVADVETVLQPEGPTVYRTAHGRHVTTFEPSTGKIDWTVPATALEGVAARYESELYERIVPFWTRHSIDRECGGYLTCLDREGKVYDSTKDMWLEWREVYMFAALNNRGRKNPEWVALARHGYDFLTAKGRNPDGSYATVISRDGAKKTTAAPLVAIFTHGFAAMACAELYRATGEEKFRTEAMSCWAHYRRIWAASESEWRQLSYRVIGLNVMNVFNACFGGAYAAEAKGIAAEMPRFVEPKTDLMLERVRSDWAHDLDSQYGRFVNPGHTVEATSFLFDHIAITGDRALLDFAAKTAIRMFDFGWDAERGGGFVYRDALGQPCDKTDWMLKTWWADCEAATAMLRGWKLTGDGRFLERFLLIDDYDWRNFRDPDFPEWYAYAPVDGRRCHTYKGNVRKGFFHLPRRLLDCLELLERN